MHNRLIHALSVLESICTRPMQAETTMLGAIPLETLNCQPSAAIVRSRAGHKHFSTCQAVKVAVLCESVAPAVRALADDRTPAVREAAFGAAAGWIRRHRRAEPAFDVFIGMLGSCSCKCREIRVLKP